MVAALGPGELSYQVGSGRETMFVSGGFAEVRDNTVRIVAEAGERPVEIDEARAREAEARARERISQDRAESGEPIDLLRAEYALKRALMRLQAREYRNE
jgi:F-type H+-transporting ATPase subunit epsilon